jgi:hypothetical protein
MQSQFVEAETTHALTGTFNLSMTSFIETMGAGKTVHRS